MTFLYAYIKMTNKYYQKTKKSLKRKHRKGTKIFLKKKKKKSINIIEIEIRISLKKEKQKNVEYMRNYYLAHKK